MYTKSSLTKYALLHYT